MGPKDKEWKSAKEGVDVTCSGRLFQTQAAATRKTWLPTVDSLVWLSNSDEDKLECSR